MPVRSQWRQAYLNRTLLQDLGLHLDMELLGDGLTHAMHLMTAARAGLLAVGKVILDTLARQVFRQGLAATLLALRFLDRRKTGFRQVDDLAIFSAGVVFIGNLLGFIEEAVHMLFALRRKTMQPRQLQLFLELDHAGR